MLLASSNVFYWAKVLSRFVSVQIIVQILGMVSGILIVRTLSREEYALFTIANSFQSTLNVLADSGIISALSAIGGRVFKDKSQFSELIQTSLRLRYRLAAMVVLPTIPILLWMLTSNGASLSYAILVICATLIELNFHLKTAILLMPLQLHAQINRIQTLDFLVAFSRLSSLVAARFILLNTFTSILSSAISIGLRLLYLNRWTFENIDKEASINKEYEKEITLIIRSQFSYFLFYCFQGQIGIWLISIFGQPGNVAEVGALGRLGVIFSIVNSVMANIISPSYARCQSIQTLRNRYWQILGLFSFLTLFLAGLSSQFPHLFLFILGNQYSHLENEVVLVSISAALYSIAGAIRSINASKTWILESWLIIPTTISVQILSLFFLKIATTRGIIIFGMVSILPSIFVNIWMSYKGLKKDA